MKVSEVGIEPTRHERHLVAWPKRRETSRPLGHPQPLKKGCFIPRVYHESSLMTSVNSARERTTEHRQIQTVTQTYNIEDVE